MNKPSYIDFDHKKYKEKLKTYTTKGEVGVLSYNYSKIISKYWRFKTPELAKQSANKIYNIFLNHMDKLKNYLDLVNQNKPSKRVINIFIKADICRKFLQMGYTRSMRYYYHKSGQKWKKVNNKWIQLPKDYNKEKYDSAMIFKYYLNKAKANKVYIQVKNYFNKLPQEFKLIDNM